VEQVFNLLSSVKAGEKPALLDPRPVKNLPHDAASTFIRHCAPRDSKTERLTLREERSLRSDCHWSLMPCQALHPGSSKGQTTNDK
jgi:hypothetical protein